MKTHVEYFANLPRTIERKMRMGFDEYEHTRGVDVNYKPFSLVIKNEHNEVLGALTAFTAFSEVYIDDLWVDKSQRGRGYGRQLLSECEAYFSGKGFNNINLVTSAFQAPEFYQKCGYTVEFVRENKINPQFTKTFFIKFFSETDQKQGLYP